MCGIFAFLNNSYNEDTTQCLFMKGVNRGPDNNKLFYIIDLHTKIGPPPVENGKRVYAALLELIYPHSCHMG